MPKNGIDIGNRIFFGTTNSSTHGYYDHCHKCIWLDDNILERFLTSPNLEDKAYLFDTIFHEMQHAVQHNNIDNSNIDYLTYNFIKENVIQQYDEEYYNSNYLSIFMESDARKEAILGSLEFLKGLNPDFVQVLRKKATKDYTEETITHSILSDSTKKLSVRENGTPINVSDYVGFLIQSNPQILFESPILRIEYNPDGSHKSLETLLDEFDQIEPDDSQNYSNMYSIYYGLIFNIVSQNNTDTIKLEERLVAFTQKQPDLISYDFLEQLHCHVDPTHLSDAYKRLLSITRPNTPTNPNIKESGGTNGSNQPR